MLVVRPTRPSVPLLRCSRSAIQGSLDANVPITVPLTKNVTPTARRSADAKITPELTHHAAAGPGSAASVSADLARRTAADGYSGPCRGLAAAVRAGRSGLVIGVDWDACWL